MITLTTWSLVYMYISYIYYLVIYYILLEVSYIYYYSYIYIYIIRLYVLHELTGRLSLPMRLNSAH